MREIAGRPPVVATRRRVEPIERIRTTLRRHYAKKRAHYGLEYPNFYDRDLRRLFSTADEHRRNRKASRFIQSIRRDVRRLVAEWTGSYQYTIDRVIEDMIARSDELDLRLKYPEDRTKLDFTMLVTVQTMNYLHFGTASGSVVTLKSACQVRGWRFEGLRSSSLLRAHRFTVSVTSHNVVPAVRRPGLGRQRIETLHGHDREHQQALVRQPTSRARHDAAPEVAEKRAVDADDERPLAAGGGSQHLGDRFGHRLVPQALRQIVGRAAQVAGNQSLVGV